MITDKDVSLALRNEALTKAGERNNLMRLAADLIEENGRSISAGSYTLTCWDDGDCWLHNDIAGKGIGMSEAAVIEVFDALWEGYWNERCR